ncbi:hypothetical protein [Streptomyces xiamenensis]|uniref:hypothetical protein n=1 Tax=Streptomyces xiamenensis TaxID=408015 RepID=UPI003D71C3EC
MRTAYLEGRSIAALAHDHRVSRGAIRTAVADLLPEHTASEEDAPAPELPVALDMPGKVADYLRTTELEPAERAALDQGVAVRRGQGYTLGVSAVLAVHLPPHVAAMARKVAEALETPPARQHLTFSRRARPRAVAQWAGVSVGPGDVIGWTPGTPLPAGATEDQPSVQGIARIVDGSHHSRIAPQPTGVGTTT